MNLSITTDYARDTGDAEPYLQRIAEVGFSHVHWCHQWNTDFIYSTWEIEWIESCLKNHGLRLLDLHASLGVEKCWSASRESARSAGVELVKNRVDMTARLGAQVIVMHTGTPDEKGEEVFWSQIRKSLDELEPYCRERDIRIALENGHWRYIHQLLHEYPPDYLGLCYDSGHGNIMRDNGPAELDRLKDRLIALHLHDNDRTSDQHNLPFTGTVPWTRLAEIIAHSVYRNPVNLEVSMRNAGIPDEPAFLARAYTCASRLSDMIGRFK